MTERLHGLLSGSSAHIWTNCTGSVFLIKDLPTEPPSKHADKGTKAHAAVEIMLEDLLQHQLNGSDPDIRAHLLIDDDEVLELASRAKELAWESVFKKHVTGKAYGQEDRFVIDEKLGMYGHVDLWVLEHDDKAKRVAKICDFKFGAVHVPAKKNAQLAFYAYALREEVRAAGKDIDYVVASIIQPKWEKEPYRETVFTSKQLDAWGKKFFDAAHQIFVKQKPKFKVGSWCTYCKAQGVCPKFQKELSQKTSLKLIEGDVSALPVPEQVPDEIIKNIVLRSGELATFIKACKAYVMNRHREGKPIQGTKVVEGKSKRTWVKDIDVGAFLISSGVAEPYNAPKVKGITVIEKELKKLFPGGKYVDVMQQLVTKTNPSLSVVAEDDPRPAVKDFAAMLSGVDEEDE